MEELPPNRAIATGGVTDCKRTRSRRPALSTMKCLSVMTPNWLRLAYAAELLLSIPAVYTLWSQVGGQGHLDLMPWWWKLLLGGGMCVAVVFATAATVEGAAIANRRT